MRAAPGAGVGGGKTFLPPSAGAGLLGHAVARSLTEGRGAWKALPFSSAKRVFYQHFVVMCAMQNCCVAQMSRNGAVPTEIRFLSQVPICIGGGKLHLVGYLKVFQLLPVKKLFFLG